MTPDFHVMIDRQQDVTAALRERLLSLRVRDEEGFRSDAAEIRLDDRGGTIELPRRGAELQIELGYSAGGRLAGLEEDSGRVLLGRYIVDEVELSGAPDTLTIRANAIDMRDALKQRRTMAWHDVSLGDLVRTIGRRYGLESRVTSDLASIALPHVDQTNESDLHLLTRLGEQYDAVAKQANGQLVFARRGTAKSATGRGLTAVRIVREQAASYRVTRADRPAYKSVRAYWYDASRGQRVEETAGEGEPSYDLRDDFVDQQTARLAAQARLNALNRGVGTLSLDLAPGVPTISAQTPLTLANFRSGVDGRWIVTRVVHELTNQGYTTRVDSDVPTT